MIAIGDDFDPATWPKRLNLGCGWDHREGYLNIDFLEFHQPDLVADVRDLSMLPSGHYEEIVAQDVLEHLPRQDGSKALCEWARLLESGGKLVLRVPNLLGLAYTFMRLTTIEQQKELVQCLFGTQSYDGDFHQNGYTEILLRHELTSAGFGTAEFTPFCEWLFDVVATKGESEGELRIEDCIFMTLEKPSEAVRGPVPAANGSAAGDSDWSKVRQEFRRLGSAVTRRIRVAAARRR